MAGNAYLAARAQRAGARNIGVIPTVLDPARYQIKENAEGKRFRIGWIGTKSTAGFLAAIAPALGRAERELNAEIVVIGADKLNLPRVNPTYVRWQEETEAEQLRDLSVGIIPLGSSPWDQGKCGYKLLQYMACGLPTIASPVGANNAIVAQGSTGLFADGTEAWFAALKTIHNDPKLAHHMGVAGRQRLEQHYSIAAVLPKIERSLRGVARPTKS